MRFRSAVVLLLVLFGSVPAGAVSYTVVDLGAGAQPMDINSAGDAVGRLFTPWWSSTSSQCFLWRDGVFTTFGSIRSWATAINDRGQIAGADAGRTFVQSGKSTAYLDDPHVLRPNPLAIGDDGTVVGYCLYDFDPRGFIWQGGELVIPSAEWSSVEDINAAGHMVARDSHGPLLWRDGVAVPLGPTTGPSQRYAMNDLDEVVGAYTVDGASHAFVWRAGEVVDLGVLSTIPRYCDSIATDINNKGQIVGWSDELNQYGSSAVLWENGTAVDLNTRISVDENLLLTKAVAINDNGWIAAHALDGDGVIRGVLLRPVPEPGSFVGLAGGLAWLAEYRRRCCRRRSSP